MFVNKATIIGNLTRDPELKALPSGDTKVVNFSIATNLSWYNKEKNKKEESVEYHNCVCFGKSAETIAQYMKKGSKMFVEGRLQTRSWDDKDTGKKMYRTEIVVEKFQFGPKGESNITNNNTSDEIEYPDEDINPEDIPF